MMVEELAECDPTDPRFRHSSEVPAAATGRAAPST
jgi:hypothetical protein